MSDWDVVKEFVLNSGYQPKRTNLNDLIAVILLSWEGQNEEDDYRWKLENYLSATVGGDLMSFDYE